MMKIMMKENYIKEIVKGAHNDRMYIPFELCIWRNSLSYVYVYLKIYCTYLTFKHVDIC